MPRTAKNRPSANGLDSAISLLEAEARAWAARARTMLAAVATMRKQLREVEELRRGAGSNSSSVARVRRGPGRPATSRRTPSGRSRARARAPRGQGTGSVAAAILREWGRPAKVNELLAELAKRGVTVGGMNPYNTLTATLMQRSGVKKAGPGMFAASDGRAAESAAEATGARPERKARKPRKARGAAKAGAKKERAPKRTRPAKKAQRAKKAPEAKAAEPETQGKDTPATEAPTS